MKLHDFVKYHRAKAKLTQVELAEKAGVGLRFVRELERGKATVRLDTVNHVLSLFGYEVGAVPQYRPEQSESSFINSK
jgi:y4mF family transcriptional regulator